MAILHQADLRPGKLDLLTKWLPGQPWYAGPPTPDLRKVATFRLDDPAGEVGIETLLVRAGDGTVVQTPLTYRGAPLTGGERWLVGTMEHSVLGHRWVYDACGDPVYAAVLAATILTGASQADEYLEVDGRREPHRSGVSVRGSGHAGAAVPAITTITRVDAGDPTIIVTDVVELTVVRTLGRGTAEPLTLTGSWSDQPTPVLLAHARRR
jgi:hypothetical protein